MSGTASTASTASLVTHLESIAVIMDVMRQGLERVEGLDEDERATAEVMGGKMDDLRYQAERRATWLRSRA